MKSPGAVYFGGRGVVVLSEGREGLKRAHSSFPLFTQPLGIIAIMSKDSASNKKSSHRKGLVPTFLGKKIHQREAVAIVAPSFLSSGRSEVPFDLHASST